MPGRIHSEVLRGWAAGHWRLMPALLMSSVNRLWFDRLTTNGEKASVRPVLVETR